MAQKTVGVIGSTGLIGSHLVDLLKDDASIETVRLIVRRLVDVLHPRLEMKLVNFQDYESLKLAIDGCDAIFCAIGTTQKKVQGDKVAYRKIDYDIPVHAARACLETQVPQFLLVSSVGANPDGSNFYLKLKGEVEQAVQKFPISFTGIFRPSMLLGQHKELRTGERIGQPLMKLLSPLLPNKYKPIAAEDVAKAMLQASKQNNKGFRVYEYKAMMAMLKD